MNGAILATATLWSYGLVAVAYLVLAALIVSGSDGRPRGILLLFAALATVFWALTCVAAAHNTNVGTGLVANTLDAFRYAFWCAFLGNLLVPSAGSGITRRREPIALLAISLLVASVVLGEGSPIGPALGFDDQRGEFAVRVALAVFGLMLVVQLYRHVHAKMRWVVKPLCLALASIFGFDLFLFVDALLFGRINADIWIARAIASFFVVPLVAATILRNRLGTIDVYVSRKVVVWSITMLATAVSLLVVAGASYIVRRTGGDWGRALQIELFFGTGLLLAVLLSSARFQSRLRVLVAKHLFPYRYDYREEWLRFTATLTTDSPVQTMQERTIEALADLVESPGGVLWVLDSNSRFRAAASLSVQRPSGETARYDRFARFLERTGWIVCVRESPRFPERYKDLTIPAWLASLPGAWLIVPLLSGTQLVGIVVLVTPRAPIEVDWEVRDVLKAAGRAAASYIAQMQMTEALLESRKFDAFNRMSAFVVHDLKNLVAQLSLLVANAARHRDNPEFQRDMLSTVEHVINRMKSLLLQLRAGATPSDPLKAVDLTKVVQRICHIKSGERSPIELDAAPGVLALGHEERLERVIGHLVQNALDATAAGGRVAVRLAQERSRAIVTIADEGVGMSAAFVSEKLYKPFQTTKSNGTGLGVYESSHYVSTLGGRIEFDSKEGAGTRVRVVLPLRRRARMYSVPIRKTA